MKFLAMAAICALFVATSEGANLRVEGGFTATNYLRRIGKRALGRENRLIYQGNGAAQGQQWAQQGQGPLAFSEFAYRAGVPEGVTQIQVGTGSVGLFTTYDGPGRLLDISGPQACAIGSGAITRWNQIDPSLSDGLITVVLPTFPEFILGFFDRCGVVPETDGPNVIRVGRIGAIRREISATSNRIGFGSCDGPRGVQEVKILGLFCTSLRYVNRFPLFALSTTAGSNKSKFLAKTLLAYILTTPKAGERFGFKPLPRREKNAACRSVAAIKTRPAVRFRC